MSRDRVPADTTMLLLTLSYHDGFCTVQAIWDAVEIRRLIEDRKCVLAFTDNILNVWVRRTEHSDSIPHRLTQKIARKWLMGKYIKVESALISSSSQTDWIS